MQHDHSPPWRWAWLVLSLSTLLAGCAALNDIERQLVFRPIVGESRSYSGPPKDTSEVWIPSGAAVLHAWWITTGKGHNATPAPVLLYLHGQRWNLSGHAERIPIAARYEALVNDTAVDAKLGQVPIRRRAGNAEKPDKALACGIVLGVFAVQLLVDQRVDSVGPGMLADCGLGDEAEGGRDQGPAQAKCVRAGAESRVG